MSKPNIVLLILDSARRDMFGCYGHSGGLTPNIDHLSKDSLLLMDHYAAGCGSTQAHVSLFLGQHSARHGVVHNLSEMSDKIIALPRLLKDHGYKTYGHSKASFIPPSGHEDLFGFDEYWYPGKHTSNNEATWKSRLIEELRKYPKLWNYLKNGYKKIKGQESLLRISARNFDGRESLNFLFKKIKDNNGVQPVFGYTTLLHPHTPYYPPKWCLDHVFKGEKIDPLSFDIQANVHAWINGDFGSAESAIRSMKKCYEAELLYADFLVGEFISQLKKEGLFENTILIITSDHGEFFGEHGQLNHGTTTWEEVSRLPGLIYHSGDSDIKGRITGLTSNMDIIPTLFSMIQESNYPFKKSIMDGVSIPDAGESLNKRHLVVDAPPLVLPERLKAYPRMLAKGSMFFRSVRNSQYKYTWMSNGIRHLFPVNVSEIKENCMLESHPDLADEMHQILVSYYKGIDKEYKIEHFPINMGTSAAMKMSNPVIREELKKLGYL